MIELHPLEVVQLLELSGFGPGTARHRAERLGQLARSHLVGLAQSKLSSSRLDYVRGIQPLRLEAVGQGRVVAEIEVRGSLPYMVEHGADGWDMRTTHLRSGAPGVRMSKDGHRYRSIVFEHGGPDSSGAHMPAMGQVFTREDRNPKSRAFRRNLSAAEARQMGRAVWRDAQALDPTLTAPDRGTQWGEGLAEGLVPILRGRHATDVYAGMVRYQKDYERATQSSHSTFRTISTNPKTFRWDSDEGPGYQVVGGGVRGGTMTINWFHPGIEARRLVPETMDYLGQLIGEGAEV